MATPTDALGPHAASVRSLLVKVVQSRHHREVAAHKESESRYAMGFGTQWRDLLDDTREALAGRGFQSHKLAPAGYELPIVNDALLYVWRVPGAPDAVSRFASSPTRKNGFAAAPPDPTLFEPDFGTGDEPGLRPKVSEDTEEAKVERLMSQVGGSMPVVLVMVHSSPLVLLSIEWAIAVLNDRTGRVELNGLEPIWEPEVSVDGAASAVEAFDSGTPIAPAVELQEQEGSAPDA